MNTSNLKHKLLVPGQYKKETRSCLDAWCPDLIVSLDEDNLEISNLLWVNFMANRSLLSGCKTESILNILFANDDFLKICPESIETRVISKDNENSWIVLFDESPYCLLTNKQTDLSVINTNDVGMVIMNEPENFKGIGNLKMITNLRLYSPEITNIETLMELEDIKCLDLTSCKSLSDISAISNFSQLRKLDLSKCSSITDISVLATLNNLECFLISDAAISDITPLKHFRRLEIKAVN